MAISVLTNCTIMAGGYDLSGDSNEIGIDYGAQMKDATTFRSGSTTANFPGMVTFKASGKGLWQCVDPATGPSIDPTLWADLGLADVLLSVAPAAGAAGELVFFTTGVSAGYNVGGKIGDLLPFTLAAESRGQPLVRGTIIEAATKTSTWNGASNTLGATTAAQRMFAAMHVVTVSGSSPTLDLLVQSAAASNFATPHTKFTFPQITAVGGWYLTPLAGPNTDTYWRVSATIGGTGTPTFKVAVLVGIQ